MNINKHQKISVVFGFAIIFGAMFFSTGVAHAATATTTWTFTGNAQGLADAASSTNVAFAHDATDDAVSFTQTTKAVTETEFGRKATTGETWETWGIPAGATVTNVQITAWTEKLVTNTKLTSHSLKIRIIGSGGSSVHSAGDILNATLDTTADASYQAGAAGTQQAVDTGSQASNTDVRLELEYTVTTSGGSGSAAVDERFDTIELTITYTPASDTTTLGNGTQLADRTIAPGANATTSAVFTFQTSAGTDTITAVTSTLSTITGIAKVEITNDAGTTVYGSSTNPAASSFTITLNENTLTASTTLISYRIRITPKAHADMPAPSGTEITATSTISNWTGTNTKAGSNTTSSIITIDNLSPGEVTATSTSAGTSTVTISWTNPGGDFSNLVIVRTTSTPTGSPAEGSSPSVNDAMGNGKVIYISSGASVTDTGLTTSTTYYYKLWAKDTNGNYSASGVVASDTTGGGAPNATSFTNDTDGTLTDGGRSGHQITISGTNFGTASDGNQANCSGGAGTGCVRFRGIGGNATATVVDASVSTWTSTSIVFTVSSTLATNGAASVLEVIAASEADATPLTFYIYPNITSVDTLGSNAGREYSASDTDGLVMIRGDHFGSAGTSTILSQAATEHATTVSRCDPGGYATSTACYEIPASISDSSYSGSIILTRTSDAKSSQSWTSFRVLPRITLNTPTSSATGTTVSVTGDHFCETGTCPTSGARSTATTSVKFGSTQAAEGDFVTPTSGSSTVTSASITTGGANRLLLAFVAIRNDAGQTVSSISNSGTAYTWAQVISIINGSNVRVEIWRTLATSTFSGTVTANLSASARATIIVSAYSNVNTTGSSGSGAVGTSGNTATGSSASPSVNITTEADGSLVVSALAAQGSPTVTAGSNQTIIQTSEASGGTASGHVTGSGAKRNSITSPTGNVTSSYTLGSSQNWAIIGIEIKKP